VSDARPASTTPPDATDPGPAGGDALILVVERDPHVRDLEAYFLNEAGYRVRFAPDGQAALDLARSERPAIVITEILVPRLDGLALCRALKADAALAPVQVLVFSILAAAGRAREAGADAFLMKPLAERRLVETVRELVAARRGHPPAPQPTPA
jgi:two-component system response regulator MprA